MSTKIKKILASFLIAIYLTFNALVPIANAQSVGQQPTVTPKTSNSTWYSQSFTDWYAKVYGGADDKQIFGERYTAAQVQWVFYGFFAMIVNYFLYQRGCTPTDVANLFQGNAVSAQGVKCLTSYNPMQNKSTDLAGKNLFELVFADRPLSGITYFKNIIRKFHLIPEANAQAVSPGFGYGALQPVQQLWTASRNISYGLFVLVILALAFMIMFRVKISPQAAITAQSALPKIAVALIIVTFSYAIAGFLIDLMYVVIALLSIIFSGSGFFSSNPVELFGYFTTGFFNTGVFGFLILYLGQFVITFILTGVGLGYGLFGQPGGSGVAGAAIIGGVFALLAVVVLVIMIIILIWIALRIIWTLIKAFAYVLFLTIILPLQVTIGVVVPGLGFGSWLKLYISNLVVFPITATLFALSFIFMEQSRKFVEQTITASELSQFVHVTPAQFTPGWPPLLGVGVGTISLVFLMISFFILSLVPKAAEVASGLISGKFNLGNAIGEATNPLGIRTFGTGVAKEAFGTYIGQQLYNPKDKSGVLTGIFNRLPADSPETGEEAAGGEGAKPLG